MSELFVFTRPAVDFFTRLGLPAIVAQGVVALLVVLIRVGWSNIPTISKTEGEIQSLEIEISCKQKRYGNQHDLHHFFIKYELECSDLKIFWSRLPPWKFWSAWNPPTDMRVKLLEERFREELRARLASIIADDASVYPSF